MQTSHSYIVVGSGLAGASAIEGIRQLDPRGPLARSGFQVGDMPIGHHGLQEVCGALEEAREGRSASIRLFRAGVLQEREVLPLSPDHHRSAAER